jgi:hypothetical protein
VNDLSPLSDLIADDLLLDRLGGRTDPGSEPIAALLGALATQADTPLPSRTGRRRIANKHRYLGAFAALAIAASGAGVAAAVSLPDAGPSQSDRARIAQKMDASARSDAPSALLSRLGLPRTSGTTAARGLVLARRDDGTIVLLPAALAAAEVARRGGAAATGGDGTNGKSVAGQPDGTQGDNPPGDNARGDSTPGGATADDPADGTGTLQPDDGATQAGGGQAGTPQTTSTGKKDPRTTKGTKGGTAITPTPTTTTTPTPTPTTVALTPETMLAPSTTSGPARPTVPYLPPVKARTGDSTGDSTDGTADATTIPLTDDQTAAP